jgi:hypothetical protein
MGSAGKTILVLAEKDPVSSFSSLAARFCGRTLCTRLEGILAVA